MLQSSEVDISRDRDYQLLCVIDSDSQIAVKPTTVSPKAFYKLGNDSYKVEAQRMRWDEARRQCQADDADLASILNPVAHAYISLQMFKLNEPVWIGLNSNAVGVYLLLYITASSRIFKLRL